MPDCRRKNGTLRHRAQMGNQFAGKDRSIIDQVLAAASPVPRSGESNSRVRLFKKREQRTGGCVAARGKVTGAKVPPTMPINATVEAGFLSQGLASFEAVFRRVIGGVGGTVGKGFAGFKAVKLPLARVSKRQCGLFSRKVSRQSAEIF